LNIPRFEVALDNGLGAARTDTSEPVQGRTFLSKGKPKVAAGFCQIRRKESSGGSPRVLKLPQVPVCFCSVLRFYSCMLESWMVDRWLVNASRTAQSCSPST
jgi:hypothetical protein